MTAQRLKADICFQTADSANTLAGNKEKNKDNQMYLQFSWNEQNYMKQKKITTNKPLFGADFWSFTGSGVARWLSIVSEGTR